MINIINAPVEGHTIISTKLTNTTKLSWRAKGIFIYLSANASDEGGFDFEEFVEEGNTTIEEAVSDINLLISTGFIFINSDGSFTLDSSGGNDE